MKKVLPIGIPQYATWPDPAYQLAIIASDDNHLPWFYGNFIQLFVGGMPYPYCPPPTNPWFSGFLNCPFLDVAVLNRALVNNCYGEGFEQFLIDCIDTGHYARLQVDEYYLPTSVCHQVSHNIHPLLVFGFDKSLQEFHVMAHFRRGMFEAHCVGFVDFTCAYAAMMDIDDKDYPTLYKRRLVAEAESLFDIHAVRQQLNDYLYCRDTSIAFLSKEPSQHRVWGLEVYDWFKKQIFKGESIGSESLRLHDFRLLWEHKVVMLKRLEYLTRRGYLVSEALKLNFEEIVRGADHLRLISIRYALDRRRTVDTEGLILKITELQERERQAISLLVDALRE